MLEAFKCGFGARRSCFSMSVGFGARRPETGNASCNLSGNWPNEGPWRPKLCFEVDFGKFGSGFLWVLEFDSCTGFALGLSCFFGVL